MSLTKNIGNRIAEARRKVNLSQAQLAESLFISAQAVGKWERGESMPDITTFDRLAGILGVDLNYFSDNADSSNAEEKPLIDIAERPVTLTPEKQEKKLNWDMSQGNWVDADFSGLKNLKEKFSASNMQRCKFIGSDLAGLLLKGNNVDSCDFSRSDISKSKIQGSNIGNTLFKDCKLTETEFTSSNIERCDFSGANLTGTEFMKSFLYGCDFTGVDFTGVSIKFGGFTGIAGKSGDIGKNTISKAVWNRTSFVETEIADIIFEGSMAECYFENCEFTRVTFRHASLLNTFFKNNEKLKRVKFEDCTADRMTYEFLKQGKAELSGITLIAG
jgi:uncharacterized protein YjbI with pentapeptide repeats